MKIAIIGTGVMGTGIGLTLRRKGHEVDVWNRTPANAVEAVAGGAMLCDTPRGAMAGGSREAWTAAEPVLTEISATRHHMGEAGDHRAARLMPMAQRRRSSLVAGAREWAH